MPQIANWPPTPAEAQAILKSHPAATPDQLHTCKVCGNPYWCPPNPNNGRFRSFCSKRCYQRHHETNPSFKRYRQSDKGKAMRQRVVSKSASRPEAIARRAQHQRWVRFVLTLDPSQRPFDTTPWPTCTTDGCCNINSRRNFTQCTWCSRQAALARSWRNAGKPCKECGNPLTRYQSKYCSTTCSNRGNDKLFRKNNPDAYRSQKRLQKKRSREKRRLLKLEAFNNGEYNIPCVECSEVFNAFGHNGKKLKFCSRRCSQKNHYTNRRARKRKAFVEVVSVKRLAKWQGWKCYHCGRKIDSTKKAPHPRSLTLEHLVPLSKGGEHSYANTAASCWDCNCIIKGNRAIGEQLKLV